MLAHIALVHIFGLEEGSKIWDECHSPELTMTKGLPMINPFKFREYLMERHSIEGSYSLKEIVEKYYPDQAKQIAKDILYTTF